MVGNNSLRRYRAMATNFSPWGIVDYDTMGIDFDASVFQIGSRVASLNFLHTLHPTNIVRQNIWIIVREWMPGVAP